jgi:hypothetical protein
MEGRSDMHRRNLILRRFGALTFGLGYFEDGEWVDHTALPDRGRDLRIAGTTSEDQVAIHALLSCCGPATDHARTSVGPIPIRAVGAAPAAVVHHTDPDVDAVARRSSAL